MKVKKFFIIFIIVLSLMLGVFGLSASALNSSKSAVPVWSEELQYIIHPSSSFNCPYVYIITGSSTYVIYCEKPLYLYETNGSYPTEYQVPVGSSVYLVKRDNPDAAYDWLFSPSSAGVKLMFTQTIDVRLASLVGKKLSVSWSNTPISVIDEDKNLLYTIPAHWPLSTYSSDYDAFTSFLASVWGLFTSPVITIFGLDLTPAALTIGPFICGISLFFLEKLLGIGSSAGGAAVRVSKNHVRGKKQKEMNENYKAYLLKKGSK